MMVISTSENSDRALWDAFLRGDKEAYAEIYQTYFSMLYEYGVRLCKNTNLVKDSIQDLFVKLWLNRENLSATTSVKPYLYNALRNGILNKLEQANRRFKREDRSLRMVAFEMNYTVEETMIFDEEEAAREEEVLQALDQLTPHQKECIFLRFYIGLEYPEIAEMMHISVKASYKVIGRAIVVMRKYFKEIAVYSVLFMLWMLLS